MLDEQFSASDDQLKTILDQAKVVAIVGESNDHYYTSCQVAQYLKAMGYRVYPVNPTIAEVDGERSYPSLASPPEAVDIVDVFRFFFALPVIIFCATILLKRAVLCSEVQTKTVSPTTIPSCGRPGFTTKIT